MESYSSISTYLACPLRYRFRYVDHVPIEIEPARFALGSAVHRAFEAFVRQRIAARRGEQAMPSIEELLAPFDECLEASGCAAEEIQGVRARGRPLLERFFVEESASKSEPVGVEMGFGLDVDVPGGPPVRFVGYIDRIDRRDGAIELIDYKAAPVRPQAWVDEDLQLTAYAYALARGALCDPSTSSPVEAASRMGLWFVEDGIVVWTTRSAAQLEAFERLLGRVVAAIRSGSFAPDPGPGRCQWCDYASICAMKGGAE